MRCSLPERNVGIQANAPLMVKKLNHNGKECLTGGRPLRSVVRHRERSIVGTKAPTRRKGCASGPRSWTHGSRPAQHAPGEQKGVGHCRGALRLLQASSTAGLQPLAATSGKSGLLIVWLTRPELPTGTHSNLRESDFTPPKLLCSPVGG